MIFQVLLIEDEPDDIELVKRSLSDSDFAVFASTTAKVACKFLETSEADIILLDLSLPNGEGIELIRRVSTVAKLTPIILLTGSDDETLIKSAIEEGIAGFVSKQNMNQLALLTAMELAVRSRKAKEKTDVNKSETLAILETKIKEMKERGDQVINELEKKVINGNKL